MGTNYDPGEWRRKKGTWKGGREGGGVVSDVVLGHI